MGSSGGAEEVASTFNTAFRDINRELISPLGYNPETGKANIKDNYFVRAIDESIGEVTGRNMARDQAWMAEKRMKQEETDRAKMLADEALQKRNEDIAASNQAGAIRSRTGSGSKPLQFQPLGEETDFLGL